MNRHSKRINDMMITMTIVNTSQIIHWTTTSLGIDIRADGNEINWSTIIFDGGNNDKLVRIFRKKALILQ